MNPSDEIKNAVLRLYEAMGTGDASAIQRLLSHQSGVLAIGSDPIEWWSGYATIEQAFKVQLEQRASKPIQVGELTAFVEGTVGWSADRRIIFMPNGKQLVVRETAVFHKEDGEWKIVQFHASLGMPNTELEGRRTYPV